MGQVLHGSVTTTEAIRSAIQRSQESLRAVAKRHGINPKTVAKAEAQLRRDLPTSPKQPNSTVLSAEEEALLSRCTGTPCCRSTTASMRSNRRSGI